MNSPSASVTSPLSSNCNQHCEIDYNALSSENYELKQENLKLKKQEATSREHQSICDTKSNHIHSKKITKAIMEFMADMNHRNSSSNVGNDERYSSSHDRLTDSDVSHHKRKSDSSNCSITSKSTNGLKRRVGDEIPHNILPNILPKMLTGKKIRTKIRNNKNRGRKRSDILKQNQEQIRQLQRTIKQMTADQNKTSISTNHTPLSDEVIPPTTCATASNTSQRGPTPSDDMQHHSPPSVPLTENKQLVNNIVVSAKSAKDNKTASKDDDDVSLKSIKKAIYDIPPTCKRIVDLSKIDPNEWDQSVHINVEDTVDFVDYSDGDIDEPKEGDGYDASADDSSKNVGDMIGNIDNQIDCENRTLNDDKNNNNTSVSYSSSLPLNTIKHAAVLKERKLRYKFHMLLLKLKRLNIKTQARDKKIT